MSISQNFIKAAVGIGMCLAVVGCDQSPPQDRTNPTVDKVLATPNPGNNIHKYFIIEEKGVQTGVVYILRIEEKGGDLCADYIAWSKTASVTAAQSDMRTRCLPKSLLQQSTPK